MRGDMPELPEVETVMRQILSSNILKRKILLGQVHNPSTVGGDVEGFTKGVIDSQILAITRRGKYLVFHLSSGFFILAHLRMSGHFYVRDSFVKKDAHEHIGLSFEGGSWLIFHDPRKFGRVLLVEDPNLYLNHLGIEPLSENYTWGKFKEIFKTHRNIKTVLLDQTCIAGLGNIYVDETLFACGIHPLRRAIDLNHQERRKLFEEIPHQLLQGIKFQGTSLGKGVSNFHAVNGQSGKYQERLQVYQKANRPCPNCQRPITKIRVGQRGTHVCAHCQN
ncbi:MAG: DNA-formamidopyrimidine glycosylase [Chlamydiae bacterium]|nr:DNA-formamidopyrimidine glycosylase [Chlamydiota bacterium]